MLCGTNLSCELKKNFIVEKILAPAQDFFYRLVQVRVNGAYPPKDSHSIRGSEVSFHSLRSRKADIYPALYTDMQPE
jgi:hypothetical protein